ncbi:PAS domain-containing protein [Pseudomonas sp. LT1P18]|uniref:PAS domain-containing protein n=1 Tax=Pseudomonas arabinosi TaxID=3398357 RepID=UPI0039EEFC7D
MIEYDQQLLVRALDAATNPVLITERTGCIVWINKAFCLLSGYSKPEPVAIPAVSASWRCPLIKNSTNDFSTTKCPPTSPASAIPGRESHKRQTVVRR